LIYAWGAYSFPIVLSFVVVSLQVLWGEGGDILIPFKAAIYSGYSVVFFHMAYETIAAIRQRSLEAALMSGIDLIILSASVAALSGYILGFLRTRYAIAISYVVMPFEVRVIVTIAFLILVIFLVIAVTLTVQALTRRGR
jgi:hypothetical protein